MTKKRAGGMVFDIARYNAEGVDIWMNFEDNGRYVNDNEKDQRSLPTTYITYVASG